MEPGAYRAGLRKWIDDNAELFGGMAPQGSDIGRRLMHQAKLQRCLFDAGWMRWGWPEAAGGLGGSVVLRAVLGEELVSLGLVHTTSWSMHEVLGPAVVEYGSRYVVSDIVPKLLKGEEFWCQGFSEPEAGSDLGSLLTTAVNLGNDRGWLINGEKLWTSFAHYATRCVVLARTAGPGTGSRGLSAFLVDMNAPGVAVRPIQTMANVDEFCSTSFVDVEVPESRLLGAIGDGWRVAAHILGCERGPIFWQRGAWLSLHLTKLLGSVKDERGEALLGEAYQQLWAFRCRSMATLRRLESGAPPGPQASIDKIMIAGLDQTIFDAAEDLLAGALEFGDSADAEAWRREWAYSRAATIYGGTTEIQKDIVSRQLLGLPRET